MNYGEENEVLLAKWLSGEVTDEELKNIMGEEEFQGYQKLIKTVDNLDLDEYNTIEQFDAVKRKISQKKVKETRIFPLKRYMPYVAAAASVLLLAVFYFLFPNNQHGHYLTGVGEHITVELPDGSVVKLNANSSMELDVESFYEARHLTLKGEAFFKVKKGAPFTVTTQQVEVTVLGTSFNIKDRPNGSSVDCYTGKVSVGIDGSSDDMFLLTSGKGVSITSSKKPNPIQFNPSAGPSWVNGVTHFDAIPLHVVMDELKNQYEIEFQYQVLSGNALFSGSFVHDDLSSALDMVFGAMEIDYIVSDNNTVVLK